MIRICVFASGKGTNAENIIRHFQHSSLAKVSLVVCNNPNAGVINVADENAIPVLLVSNESLHEEGKLTDQLKKLNIDFIVLAGFLRKIPDDLVRAYKNKIVNIHPALLPDFGGKGMYGMKVHETVMASGTKETGISIHYVTEIYDEGKIIFQAKFPVEKNDTHESIEKKVHELEYRHYPAEIEKLIKAYES